MNEWNRFRPPSNGGNWVQNQGRCAGTGQPCLPGSYCPASRTGRCPACLQWRSITQEGLLHSHAQQETR